MKLGRETGSYINSFLSQETNPDPQIGMGATVLSWTDRMPATVMFIDQVKDVIGIQMDNYVRTDTNGIGDVQEYDFSPNSKAPVRYYKKNKKGAWVGVIFNEETKRWNSQYMGTIVLGRRERYYDFSF